MKLFLARFEKQKLKIKLEKVEELKLMKILVMGLPGSGKTYLSERLVPLIKIAWYNADAVSKMTNDWDTVCSNIEKGLLEDGFKRGAE